jgi:hypothetical protein
VGAAGSSVAAAPPQALASNNMIRIPMIRGVCLVCIFLLLPIQWFEAGCSTTASQTNKGNELRAAFLQFYKFEYSIGPPFQKIDVCYYAVVSWTQVGNKKFPINRPEGWGPTPQDIRTKPSGRCL